MQIQITFKGAYPMVLDTKDLTTPAGMDAVLIATSFQLSCSGKVHSEPKGGTGEYAPGLWCHVYGYDFRRKGGGGIISPRQIAHLPVLSAAELAQVLEVRLSGQLLLKSDPAFGLLDLQSLTSMAQTYLDESGKYALFGMIAELARYFSKSDPVKSPEDIARLIADEAALPLPLVLAAIEAAAEQDGEDAGEDSGPRGGFRAPSGGEAAAEAGEEDEGAEGDFAQGDDWKDDEEAY